MKIQKNFIKKISCLLIISLLSLNLTFLTVPKKTEALGVEAVFDTPNLLQMLKEYGEKINEAAIVNAFKILGIKVIQHITYSTVEWINTGFEGNPAYVANLGQFLGGEGGVVDQTIGDFFTKEPGLAFLCEPFQLQVKLALQLGLAPTLKEKIGCTFTQVTENVENALNNVVLVDSSGRVIGKISNFTSNGGWDSWLKNTLEPQNNPVGAYLLAKAELETRTNQATESKKLELASAGFALSLNKCTDTYIDENGRVVGQSEDYIENFNRPDIPKMFLPEITNEWQGNERRLVSNVGVSVKQNCVVKTPGSAITEMVGVKSTNDLDQAKLSTAFANGINSVLNALFNVFLNNALSQLRDGVLGNSSTTFNDNDKILNDIYSKLYQDYVNQLDGINDTLNNPYATTTITSINFDNNFNFGYSTSSIYATTTPNTNYGYSALDIAKNNANNLINSLTKSELTYQNNYLVAQNILVNAQNIFASSSECNIKANKSGSMLRAYLINSNVIENIKGTVYTDNYRVLAQIPWNLAVIKNALANSNSKMDILEEASTKVSLAGSIDAVKDALIPVNSTSFNTDPQITMVRNIKTWLSGVQSMYNTEMCPIDLTKVMEIVSPATSTSAI